MPSTLLISACLAGDAVRYNATALPVEDAVLTALRNDGRLVVVCPEVAGGLPVPRSPAEIVGGDGDAVLEGRARVVARSGVDVTDAFVAGAREALRMAKTHHAVAAVLTERSPSCGSNLIYNGRFEGVRVPGHGITTALLRRHGIPVFNQDELRRAVQFLGAPPGIADTIP